MAEEKSKTKTKRKVSLPSLEEMLKAGVHFGHRTSKWNPKMEPYIFTSRNNVHVLDLEKTHQQLEKAADFLSQIKARKGIVLFVGTKAAAKEITKKAAEEAKMPFVTERWLGGTLTNFKGISKRLEYYRDLEKKKTGGELKKYTKKEQHEFDKELNKLNQQFGGIKNLLKVPDALFIVDVKQEKTAVKEANMSKIPIVGICDTTSDPTQITYPIPANDDASSALKLIVGVIVKSLK